VKDFYARSRGQLPTDVVVRTDWYLEHEMLGEVLDLTLEHAVNSGSLAEGDAQQAANAILSDDPDYSVYKRAWSDWLDSHIATR